MDWFEIAWFASYITVFLGLSIFGIHRYTMVYLFLKHSKETPEPKGKFEELPIITVQLPIFNEMYVVERLIQAVGKIDYPKEKLQIQVLDDSTDETQEICKKEVEKLKEEGHDAVYIHRVDRTGFKAGALENGMTTAKGEFIFILDADFVPDPDILMNMVHHFTDESVGMVQARWGHMNRRYSLLTRIQAMFLDGHLIMEQTARSRSGRFFNFNGTGGMWRKKAISDSGGWQHDTLTEDLDLSYRAQMKGWKFVFLKDVVTPAELPVDMVGFKSQQHRWTKGSIQTCKKLLSTVWRSDQPILNKIEATFHLASNFTYLLLFLLCILVYPRESAILQGWVRVVFLDIPIFFTASFSVVLFYLCSQRDLYPGKWWKEIIYLPALLGLGIGMSINNGKAVLEAVFNQESDFIRTPKYGIQSNERQTLKKRRYRALGSLCLILEVALAFYFTYLVWYSATIGNYASMVFLFLFQFGFIYVALGSLNRLLADRFQQSRGGGDDSNPNPIPA